MYVDGSSAYRLEPDFLTETPKEEKVRKPRVNARQQKRARMMRRRRGVLILACLFLVSMFSVSRIVREYDLHSQIEEKTKELTILRAGNEQAEMELVQMTDLVKVEEYAIATLGMQKPQSYQVVYLEETNGDIMRKTAKTEKESKLRGLFGILSSAASGVQAYFR